MNIAALTRRRRQMGGGGPANLALPLDEGNWATSNGATVSNGEANWPGTGSGAKASLQAFLETGAFYKAAFNVSAYTIGNIRVRFGTSASQETITITGPGEYETGVYEALGAEFFLLSNGNPTTLTIDAVTVLAVPAPVAPPSASGALPDVTYTQGSGDQTVDASGDFAGAVSGTWSVTGTGASIDQSGVVSITTAALRAASAVTVTYTNSGGSADSAFNVTVEAAAGGLPTITRQNVAVPQTPPHSETITAFTPAAGDMILVLEGSDANPDGSTVSGNNSGAFNVLDTIDRGSIDGLLAYAIQGATPDTAITIDLIAQRSQGSTAILVHILGVNTGAPIANAAVTSVSSTNSSPKPPALTTSEGALMRVVYAVLDDDVIDEANIAAPAGFDGLIAYGALGASGGNTTVMMAFKYEADAGTVDPGEFVVSGDADQWAAGHLAIRLA